MTAYLFKIRLFTKDDIITKWLNGSTLAPNTQVFAAILAPNKKVSGAILAPNTQVLGAILAPNTKVFAATY